MAIARRHGVMGVQWFGKVQNEDGVLRTGMVMEKLGPSLHEILDTMS